MKFGTALGVSVALHALLGASIAACIALAPKPDVSAYLDLSSVDISFAEEDVAEAAAVPPRPAPPPAPPAPRLQDLPPEPDASPNPPPPAPSAIPAPEPPAERPKMDTPPAAEARPVESRPANDAPSAEEAPESAPRAPRQAKVDAPPKPRRNIRPDYPKGARIRGEQGDVVLEIAVGASGEVEKAAIVVSSGYPELDEAAARAARAARFVPAKSGGRAVSAVARLTLSFRLK